MIQNKGVLEYVAKKYRMFWVSVSTAMSLFLFQK